MITPGSVSPQMWGQGDPLDELGKEDRSVRLRVSAGGHFWRNFTADGNRTKWTAAFAIKPGSLDFISGTYALMGTVHQNSNGGRSFAVSISGGKLSFGDFNNSGGGDGMIATLVTTRVFRDPAAFYFVQVVWDTGNATASDRLRIYINGQRVTTFDTANYPALNYQSYWNSAASGGSGGVHRIGAQEFTVGGVMRFFDGPVGRHAFVDGQALAPAAFGQIHPLTRQWRPYTKARIRANVAAGGGARNGWGANGHFLPFDDATSTTTLGYDRSQSDTDTTGNNWTANNISLTPGPTYDSMIDTPTTNYAVINALNPRGSSTVSDGCLKEVCGASVLGRGSSIPMNAGRWRAQATINGANGGPGQAWLAAIIGVVPSNSSGTFTTVGVGYDSYSGQKYVSGAVSAYGSVWRTNGATYVVDIDLNIDAGYVEFYLDGVAQGQITLPAAADGWVFKWDWFSIYGGGNATWNFGQQPWTHSILSSVKGISTKNMRRPPIPNSENAFVARTDTGANIVATITAAAPWPDWIRVFKSRGVEGWRWQFSDDAANCLESNNTNAKIAFPALGGASYVAQAIKVAASNGVSTGRLVHANGVADVVSDGLSNNRKMVMLRNEAGGNWFVYHPELTAGKLLYLNLQSAETTDATISAVTASGFTVAAALASGTYRWISFAEVEGFLKLWRYIANGSADAPFHNDGLAPVATWWRDADTGTNNWHMHDTARDPYNQSNSNLVINLNDAESSQHGMDLTSSGVKLRVSTSGSNLSGAKHVGISFGQPFRYSNAR